MDLKKKQEKKSEEKKKKPQDPTLMLLGLGIAFMVLGTMHWAFPILGIFFLIGFGYLKYAEAKEKLRRGNEKNEKKKYSS